MFEYARTLTFNMMLVVKVTDALSFREPYINTTYSFQAEDKDEVTDEDVSEASLYDTAEEDEMTEEEALAISLSDRKEEDEVTEEVVPAVSVSETNGEEPIHLSNQ